MPGETNHKIGVVVIDQLSQFTSFRAAETFFEPLQLHLQPPDLSWIVLRPLIASMATLDLYLRLWVRRLINSFGEGYAYVGSPSTAAIAPWRSRARGRARTIVTSSTCSIGSPGDGLSPSRS